MISKRMSSPLAVLLAAMMVAVCAVGVVSLYSDGSDAVSADVTVDTEDGLAEAVKVDGNIIALSGDIVLSETLKVTGKDVTLRLGGHSISMPADKAFESSTSRTVDDAKTTNSVKNNNGNAVVYVSGAGFKLVGGTVEMNGTTMALKTGTTGTAGNVHVVTGDVDIDGTTVKMSASLGAKDDDNTVDAALKVFNGTVKMVGGTVDVKSSPTAVVGGVSVTYSDTAVAGSDAQKIDALKAAKTVTGKNVIVDGLVVDSSIAASSSATTASANINNASVKVVGDLSVTGKVAEGDSTEVKVTASFKELSVTGTTTVGVNGILTVTGTAVFGTLTVGEKATFEGTTVSAKTATVSAESAGFTGGAFTVLENGTFKIDKGGFSSLAVAKGAKATIGVAITGIASIVNEGTLYIDADVTVTTSGIITNKSGATIEIASKVVVTSKIANAGDITLDGGMYIPATTDPVAEAKYEYTQIVGDVTAYPETGSDSVSGTVTLNEYSFVKGKVAGYVVFAAQNTYVGYVNQSGTAAVSDIGNIFATCVEVGESTTTSGVGQFNVDSGSKVLFGKIDGFDSIRFVSGDVAVYKTQSKTGLIVSVDEGVTLTVSAAVPSSITGTGTVTKSFASVTLTVKEIVVEGTVNFDGNAAKTKVGSTTANAISTEISAGAVKVIGTLDIAAGSKVTVSGATDVADGGEVFVYYTAGSETTENNVKTTKDALVGVFDVKALKNAGTITVDSKAKMEATDVTVDGTINANGTVSFTSFKGTEGSVLAVTSELTVTGKLTVSGTVTLNAGSEANLKDVAVEAGTFTSAGKLAVSGTFTVGAVDTAGKVVSSAKVEFDSAVTVTGDVTVYAGSSIDADAAFTSAALAVNDGAAVALNGTSVVKGALTVGNGASVAVSAKLTVAGDVAVAEPVEASAASPAKETGILAVDGNLVLSKNLVKISGTVTVGAAGAVNFAGFATGTEVTFALAAGAVVYLGIAVDDASNKVLFEGVSSVGAETTAVYGVVGSIGYLPEDIIVPEGSQVVYNAGSESTGFSVGEYYVSGSMTVNVPATESGVALGDVYVDGTLEFVAVGTAKTGESFKAEMGEDLSIAVDAEVIVGADVSVTTTDLDNEGTVTVEAGAYVAVGGNIDNSGDVYVDGTLVVSGITNIGDMYVDGTVKFANATGIDEVLVGADYEFGAAGAVVYTIGEKSKAIAGPQHVVPKTAAGAYEYTVAITVSAGTSVEYLDIDEDDAKYDELFGKFVGFDGDVTFNESVVFGDRYSVVLGGDSAVKAGATVTFGKALYNVGTMTLEASTANGSKIAKISGPATDSPPGYAGTLYNLGTVVMEDSSNINFDKIYNGYYFEAADADVEDMPFNEAVIVAKSGLIHEDGTTYDNTFGTIEVYNYNGVLIAAKFVKDTTSFTDEMEQYVVGKVVLENDVVFPGDTAEIRSYSVDNDIPVDLNGHTITVKAGYKDEYVHVVYNVTVTGLYVKSGDNAARFASITTYAYDSEKAYSDVVISAGSVSVEGDIARSSFTVADVVGTLDLADAKFAENVDISVAGSTTENAAVNFGDLKTTGAITVTGTAGKTEAVFGDVEASSITGTNTNVTIDGTAKLGAVSARILVIGEDSVAKTGALSISALNVVGDLTVNGNIVATESVNVQDGAKLTTKITSGASAVVFAKKVAIDGTADIAGYIATSTSAAAETVSINGSVVVRNAAGINAKTLTVTGDLQTKKITVSADGKFTVKSGANVTGVVDDDGAVSALAVNATGATVEVYGTLVAASIGAESEIVYSTIAAEDIIVGADGTVGGNIDVTGKLVNDGVIAAKTVKAGIFYDRGVIVAETVEVTDMYTDKAIGYEITVSGRLFAEEAVDLSKVTFTGGYGTFLFDVPAVSTAIEGEFSVVYVAVGQYLNAEGETLVPADNAGYFVKWKVSSGSEKYPSTTTRVDEGEASMSWTFTAVFNNQFGEQTWFDVTVDLVGKEATIDLGALEPGYTFTTGNVFLAVVFYDIDGNVIASDNLVVYSVNGAPSIGNRNVVTCEYLTDGNGYKYGGNTATPYAVTVQMYYWAATGNDAYHLITLGYDMDATEYSVTLNFDVEDETETLTSEYMYKETVEYPTAAELNELNPGFTFLHWSLTAGGEAVEPVAVMDGKDYTYYAVYEAKTNTVTFDLNGHGQCGSEIFQVLSGRTVSADDLAEVAEAASDEHYDFAGWYLDAACTEPADVNAKIYSDMTFYAKWEPKEYTVTFVVDGTEYDSEKVPYDTVAPMPEAPSKTRYDFQYWAVDGTEYDAASKVVADITLVAVFKGIDVGFTAVVATGCEDFGSVISLTDFEYGATLVLGADGKIGYTDYLGEEVVIATPVAKDQDEHNSYAFVKWVYADNTDVTFPIVGTADVAVYAVFEMREIQFDVTVTVDDHATATGAGKVTRNTNADVKITAADGYHITKVVVNDVEQSFVVTQSTPTEWKYTELVTGDVTIEVTTEISTFVLSAFVATSSDGHGSISGTNQILAKNGENISVSGNVISFGSVQIEAVADSEYVFKEWRFNDEPYTGGAITGDMKVFAVFESTA